MLVAAFALFLLMLVSWMVAPDSQRVSKPIVEKVPTAEPTMVPAI